MNAIASQQQVKNSFWGETDDLSLFQAALLTFGIDPFSFKKDTERTGESVTLASLPDGFQNRIEALRSAIRTKSIKPVAGIPGKDGLFDENTTRIKTDDFVDWCAAKGLPHNIPHRTVPQPTAKWPWGDYETDLLKKLAVAAEEWWSDYDPKNSKQAPTNDAVSDWLKGQGVSDRVAEVMAQILRADGLPTGPRK